MPINVVCPGCHKRFSVSDRFAGQKGPCPACKTVIEVPREQVKVHAPEEFASGGRGKSGRMVSRPLRRIQLTYSGTQWAALGAGTLGVAILTPILGRAGLFSYSLVAVLGLAAVSPLFVFALYPFLTAGDDLDPFGGPRLRQRATLCGLAFAGVWLCFEMAAGYTFTGAVWQWWIVVPLFIVGVLIAYATLDFDPSTSVLLFTVYAGVMMILRWMAHLGWVWTIVRASGGGRIAPDPTSLF